VVGGTYVSHFMFLEILVIPGLLFANIGNQVTRLDFPTEEKAVGLTRCAGVV